MPDNAERPPDWSGLRRRAEAVVQRARTSSAPRGADVGQRDASDLRRLVFELEVHQVELELQNEELRSAQQALLESRDRYQALYDLAPVGYLTLDRWNKIDEGNMAAAALLGVDRARLAGRHLSSFVDEAAADELHRHLGEVFAGGVKLGCDLVVQRGALQDRTLHIESIAIEDSAGPRTRCRSVLVDLTELRTAQAQRRRSEAQASVLLDTAVDAIISSDDKGRITSFNKAAERLFGYAQAQAVGRNVRMLVPAIERAFQRYLATGEAWLVDAQSRELDGRRKDGTTFPMELGIGEWRDGDQRMFVAVVHDLTERRRAEESVRQSEHRFRQIADHLEDVLAIIDRNSARLQYASRAFETIWARSVHQLRESTDAWPQWVHPEDRERIELSYRNYLKGDPFDEDCRVLRPGGQVRWIRARVFPIPEEDGCVHSDVAVFQDITSDLEREQELRQAQKLEAVGSLATGVAHDIGNVLQAALGCINLSRSQRLDNATRAQYLDRASSVIKRGASLTSRLMTFARKQQPDLRPVEVDALVNSLAPLLERLVTERVKLEIDAGAPGVFVVADSGQLEQLLLNLAANARDAMPDGGVLSIRSDVLDPDAPAASWPGRSPAECYVRLVVRDTGVGMDEATLKRIFEPFFTTKEVGKGTGMGLSTVFAVTQQLGGHVGVDSEPGKGSAFTLRFPGRRLGSQTQPVEPGELPQLRGTVLLVEDESTIRATVRHELEDLGLAVLEAKDGDEAQRVWLAHVGHVDLLITDVTLPGMQGPQLVARLREHAPALPVLLISAAPESALVEGGVLPELPLLRKPFGERELASRLALLLPAAGSAPVASARAAVPGVEDRAAAPCRDVTHADTTILVVEDETTVRDALETFLSSEGYQVRAAARPSEALEAGASLKHLDLLITDVQLPEMNGNKLADQLRARHPRLQVILMSGLSEPPENASAVFVPKPVDLDALLELVSRMSASDSLSAL